MDNHYLALDHIKSCKEKIIARVYEISHCTCACIKKQKCRLYHKQQNLHGRKTFVVFADFQQTTKVFPTNLISAILSADIYLFSCLSKAKPRKFSLHYDKIQ